MRTIPLLLLFAAAPITYADQPLTLDQALKAAKSRPALLAASLKVASAKQDSRSLGALPPLSVGAGLSSHPDLGATDEDLFLRQSLDLFGRSSAGKALGKVRQSKAEAEARAVALGIQTEVMTRFFEASSAFESALVAVEIREVAEKVWAATTRRFEEGRVPEVQVLRTKMELDRARQQERLLMAQKQSALKLLAGAIGSPDPVLSLEQRDLALSLSQYPGQRPDVVLAQLEIDEVKAEARSAKSGLMPEVDLYGLRSGWSNSEPRYGARLQVTWNLWDQGKGRAEAKSLALKESSLAAAKKDAIAKAQAEIDLLWLEIKAAQDQLASYAELIAQAKVLVEKSQKGFNEGVGTLVEVLESTRSLREVEQESIAVRLRLNLLKTASLQASGTLMESMK